jgi:hypothetical protein
LVIRNADIRDEKYPCKFNLCRAGTAKSIKMKGCRSQR